MTKHERKIFRMQRRASFTLMEVLVAITILGMISSLIYSSFARSLEIPPYIRDIQERYHKVRIAMNRMASEISMAYMSKHVDPNTEESPRYIFRVKKDDPGSRIDFTSLSHFKMYEDVNESDQCEIGYFLMRDPLDREKLNLVRREQKRIDQEPGWGGPIQVLCDDVVDFEVKIWDFDEEEWMEEWDTTQVEQFEKMPRIISLKLTILDENGKELPFYTKAKIVMDTALDLNSI